MRIVSLQIAFETVMIVRDLFTGGKRSFASTADAREFRSTIYRIHDLEPPSPGRLNARPPQVLPLPRRVTSWS